MQATNGKRIQHLVERIKNIPVSSREPVKIHKLVERAGNKVRV